MAGSMMNRNLGSIAGTVNRTAFSSVRADVRRRCSVAAFLFEYVGGHGAMQACVSGNAGRMWQ